MQEAIAGDLTIGDLAAATGMTAPTLRMWESRHGFPVPRRRESGHRRYAEGTVDQVRQVLRRRDAGVRLETAIAEVTAGGAPTTPSIYAELRRRHPHLVPHQLHKSTLTAISRALEDECCARAHRATVFGAFQREEFFRRSAGRWAEIARAAGHAMAFADFPSPGGEGRLALVPLAEDAPLRREWAVVCDAADLSAVLTAWELPGQQDVPDAQRVFESIWTLEPAAVRTAARVCAAVAAEAGVGGAAGLVDDLAAPPASSTLDPVAAGQLFNRVVAYVDRQGRQ
jgi:DNA-binding transcriptional MerR regulator